MSWTLLVGAPRNELLSNCERSTTASSFGINEPDNVNQKISLYMIPLQAATPVYSTTPLFWHSTRTLSIKIHAYLYSGRTKSAMVLGSPS